MRSFFFIGYASDFDHYADQSDRATAWLVAAPFAFGSMFFWVGSWMAQYLWKIHDFGLGFAKELKAGSNDVAWKVDWGQQFMIVIYTTNLCGNLLEFAVLLFELEWTAQRWARFWDCCLRILAYTGILGLASAVHITPKEHPYVVLYWIMRVTCFCDLIGQAALVHALNPLLMNGFLTLDGWHQSK